MGQTHGHLLVIPLLPWHAVSQAVPSLGRRARHGNAIRKIDHPDAGWCTRWDRASRSRFPNLADAERDLLPLSLFLPRARSLVAMRRASRYATVGHADVLMRAVEIWERAAATIPLLERVVDLLKDLRAGLPISSEELVHGNMGKEGAETVDVAGM